MSVFSLLSLLRVVVGNRYTTEEMVFTYENYFFICMHLTVNLTFIEMLIESIFLVPNTHADAFQLIILPYIACCS